MVITLREVELGSGNIESLLEKIADNITGIRVDFVQSRAWNALATPIGIGGPQLEAVFSAVSKILGGSTTIRVVRYEGGNFFQPNNIVNSVKPTREGAMSVENLLWEMFDDNFLIFDDSAQFVVVVFSSVASVIAAEQNLFMEIFGLPKSPQHHLFLNSWEIPAKLYKAEMEQWSEFAGAFAEYSGDYEFVPSKT